MVLRRQVSSLLWERPGSASHIAHAGSSFRHGEIVASLAEQFMSSLRVDVTLLNCCWVDLALFVSVFA
jgi:hypothetical protein